MIVVEPQAQTCDEHREPRRVTIPEGEARRVRSCLSREGDRPRPEGRGRGAAEGLRVDARRRRWTSRNRDSTAVLKGTERENAKNERENKRLSCDWTCDGTLARFDAGGSGRCLRR